MGVEEFQEAVEYWAGPEGGARQNKGKFCHFIILFVSWLPRGKELLEGDSCLVFAEPENFLKLQCCAGLLGYSAAGPVTFQVRGAVGLGNGQEQGRLVEQGCIFCRYSYNLLWISYHCQEV